MVSGGPPLVEDTRFEHKGALLVLWQSHSKQLDVEHIWKRLQHCELHNEIHSAHWAFALWTKLEKSKQFANFCE